MIRLRGCQGARRDILSRERAAACLKNTNVHADNVGFFWEESQELSHSGFFSESGEEPLYLPEQLEFSF